MELNDEGLVERFQQGDKQAFEILVQRYEQRIFSMAMRLTGDQQDAYDLAQESLLKVYRYLGQFRSQSTFSTWLYRIITNCFYDEMRRKKRRPAVAILLDETVETADGEMLREMASTDAGPEELSLQAELRATVQAVLAQLPPDYRIVLVLRDLEDRTYEEIAQILQLNLGTVKSRISRARLSFRKLLQREEQRNGSCRQRA